MELRRYPWKAMGSPCELGLYGDDEAAAAEVAAVVIAEIARLEAKYSRYRDDSLTARINQSAGDPGGVEVDAETAGLLDYAQTVFEQSEGLFDITSGVLRRAWNFKAQRVPSQDEIDAARARIGWDRVRWDRPRLVLPEANMEVDFGGYVKEYAADCAAEICRRRGFAHGLVDLGGDLAIVGPHPDGKPWIVGVRHPRRPETAMATLPVAAGGVASSGDYERFMVADGRRYGHILNPKTGWPVEGLLAVTVAAPQCLIAGTASTVAMLKGVQEGVRWLDALGLPNLRVAPDGRVSGTLTPRGQSGLSGRSGSSVRSGLRS